MKALLFLVLSLALCYHTSFAQIGGGWTNINPNTINSNPNIQDALIFGAHYSIQQGIEDGSIEKADYELINIFSARQQVVAGMNYEFVVEMASDTDYYVKVTYVVFVQSWKEKTMKVTSSEFSPLLQQGEADNNENEFDFLPEDVHETDGARRLSGSDESDSESEDGDEGEMATGGEWTPIDPSELNSDHDLQNAFNFGLKKAIKTSINNGSLPAQNYKKHKIYSIESQVVSGENYRFDVEVKGTRGAVARIIFEVYYQSWTDTLELIYSEVISVNN